jgi:hypothetical protein
MAIMQMKEVINIFKYKLLSSNIMSAALFLFGAIYWVLLLEMIVFLSTEIWLLFGKFQKYILILRTKLICYTCSSYFSSHKEVVILIEKQFSFIFLKLKNTKNHFFVSGTTKPAHKAIHVSFALILFI